MSRGLKVVIFIVIVLAAMFAGSSGFFYAKTISLEDKLSNQKKKVVPTTISKVTDSAAVTVPITETTKTPVAATTTVPVSSETKPSVPSDTVVVAAGETLFAIGQKAGVSWTQIAEANGIDPDKLKVGQTLIVPKNNQINFTIDKVKTASLQKDVTNGKYLFRLLTVDTVKSDASSSYGLLSTDTYTQKSIDLTAGSATVIATKGDKTYTVTLIQPDTKGEKGIWAIESIKKN